MSKLDDILGTPALYRKHPELEANRKRRLQKRLIQDLMLELIGPANGFLAMDDLHPDAYEAQKLLKSWLRKKVAEL